MRADFYERAEAGMSTSRLFTIQSGEAAGFADLVGEVFRLSDTVGTVVLHSLNGAKISANGREYAVVRGVDGIQIGTAGTLLPGLTEKDLVDPDRSWHIIGLRQMMQGSERERSHLAVFNPGSESAVVTVSLFNGSDGTYEGSRSWTIEGQELIQINNVMRKINNAVNGDEKRIEISVDRPVYLQAFRINTWGDSVTLMAEED